MEKYIKRQIMIEAIRYNKKRIGEAQDFCAELTYNPADNEYYIQTLEGNMKLTEGDYLIKGAKGEFYPCKPDIFRRTYMYMPFQVGQYIATMRGDRVEIGRIKTLEENGAFVAYHEGETGAKTPYELMKPIVNDYCIVETGLGGEYFED